MTDEFPTITPALLKAMENSFPQTDFGYNAEMSKLMFHYGQRSVINFLKSKHDQQNENLTNKMLK